MPPAFAGLGEELVLDIIEWPRYKASASEHLLLNYEAKGAFIMNAKKLEEIVVKNQAEISVGLNAFGMIIGAVIGWKTRRRMYDAGMVKSMWYGLPKAHGTYRNPKGYFKHID